MRQNEGLRKRLVRAFPCEEETGKVRILPGNVPTAETRYRKDAQARLKKGLLSLAAVFQILDNAHTRKAYPAGKKLSPPFNGI